MVGLDDSFKKYEEMFDDSFPTVPLAWNRSDEEVKKMIDRCIQEGKDAYDIGYLKLDDEVMY